MKKLLLLSLLVVGATSFAAVEGTTNNVSLPIQAVGKVLVPTGTNLVMEATTAGMNGDVMSFNFGSLEKPASGKTTVKELEGTFTVKKADATAFTGYATSGTGNLTVGFNEAGTSTSVPSTNVVTGVNINYALSGALDPEKKVYNGRIVATTTVSDTAQAGAFTDTTQRIYAVVAAE